MDHMKPLTWHKVNLRDLMEDFEPDVDSEVLEVNDSELEADGPSYDLLFFDDGDENHWE